MTPSLRSSTSRPRGSRWRTACCGTRATSQRSVSCSRATSRTTCSICCPASRETWARRAAARGGMRRCSALAPDGSPVDGFVFEGSRVRWTGSTPVEAGIRVELELPADGDPKWLVPGLFYGENRPEACARLYPRWVPDRVDVARMESHTWSFRADRCATVAVLSGGVGLATSEVSPLGQAGVGFSQHEGRRRVWLDFPYREEPLRYDGSHEPAAPDV